VFQPLDINGVGSFDGGEPGRIFKSLWSRPLIHC